MFNLVASSSYEHKQIINVKSAPGPKVNLRSLDDHAGPHMETVESTRIQKCRVRVFGFYL